MKTIKMPRSVLIGLAAGLLALGGSLMERLQLVYAQEDTAVKDEVKILKLPKLYYKGALSLEEAMHRRRSVREYAEAPLDFREVGQLLWASQGLTFDQRRKTVPSAGALYPLRVYLVAANVSQLPAGIYRYREQSHELERRSSGDRMAQLAEAALGQTWLGQAAAALVIAADYQDVVKRYGERGIRFVQMEAGHCAQNVSLQAATLRIGTVVVGAFYDAAVQELLKLPENEEPLVIMPLGKER